MLDDIKNNLNFRNEVGLPNYTHVVGLLFDNEIEYLKTLNIEVKLIITGYNLVIFKNNIHEK